MGGEADTIDNAEARSALTWWLESGVDVAVGEHPRDWLKPAAVPAQARTPPETPPIANVSQPDHATLTELQAWLASSTQLPLSSAAGKRILPHGPEQASVMLLSDTPSLEDFVAGQPIGGESWTLAQRMLTAIGVPVDHAYCASLSCFHAPGGRMSDIERQACADLARQHIRLVQPKRLLLLGEGPCQALLDKPLPRARGHLHKIEGVRTVATFHPRFLIQHPSNKSWAWRDLLLLMEEES